jgi:hypothetical protein
VQAAQCCFGTLGLGFTVDEGGEGLGATNTDTKRVRV